MTRLSRRRMRVRPYAPEPTPGSVSVPEDLLIAVATGTISLCLMAVRLR